jgi:hypothetical protein
MKAPMQELIEEMERSPLMFAPALALIKEKNFIDKEKEMMCEFAFDYNDEFQNNGAVPNVQEYYNETFNTKYR